MGDHAKAESLLRRSLDIRRKTLGDEHPDTATILNNLGALYDAMGDHAKAEVSLRLSLQATRKHLELTAAVQSERQQLAMRQSLRHRLDGYLSLAVRSGNFSESAYRHMLAWKGAVVQHQRETRALADEPELREAFLELQSVTARLAKFALGTPDPQQREAWQRQIAELSAEKERQESELVRRSTEYRRAKEEVTIEGLRARLPDGFALVDFLEYAHYIPPKKGQAGGWRYERQLVAFVVTAGGLTGPIDLGPVAPVSEAIDTWRVSFGMSPQGQAAGQVLRERVWEPVERALVERNSFRSGDGSTSGMNSALRTVLISPDGVLGRLPLGGLPGREPGKYLLEEWTLGVLPVPAMLPELLDASSRRQVDKNVLLLGDVDYDAQADAAEQAAQPTPRTFGARLAQRAVRWQDQRFDALKATGGEIASIGRMYRLNFGQEGISILEQAGATEAAFRREAPQHKYLHLATHGFFAPPGLASALSGSADPLRMMRMSGDGPGDMLGWGADVKGYHPGLLSGLALAGANRSVGMAADGDPDRGGIPDRRGSPTLPDRRGSPTPSAQPRSGEFNLWLSRPMSLIPFLFCVERPSGRVASLWSAVA
jgi:hypothetical protein